MTGQFSRLQHTELDRLLKSLPELYAPTALEDFPQRALSVLSQLVSCEISSWEEFSLDGRGIPQGHRAFLSAESSLMMSTQSSLIAFAHQHPMFHCFRDRTKRPVRNSDFVSDSSFKKTTLYNEVHRRIGILPQLAWFLPESANLQVCLVMHRKRKDFSESERECMALLSPHVRQAHTNAKVLSDWNGKSSLLAEALSSAQREAIFLDAEGCPEVMSARTIQLLRTYFADTTPLHPWPETLRRWVRQQLCAKGHDVLVGCEPLTIERPPSRLVVTLHREHDGRTLVVLTEGVQTDAPRFEERVRLASERYGLTPRQTQVLRELAHGKSNKEIAAALGCSPNTAELHARAICEKFDATGRAEVLAAMLAL